MTAREITAIYKDCVQDGNASTEAGALKWQASFLPRYLRQVLDLLAVSALDQKFDVETVVAQQRVVLEGLYLEKYSSTVKLGRLRDRLVLERCKQDGDNQALLDRLMGRTLEGAVVDDLAIETVTAEEMVEAARKYMPAHHEAYVRLALKGQ